MLRILSRIDYNHFYACIFNVARDDCYCYRRWIRMLRSNAYEKFTRLYQLYSLKQFPYPWWGHPDSTYPIQPDRYIGWAWIIIFVQMKNGVRHWPCFYVPARWPWQNIHNLFFTTLRQKHTPSAECPQGTTSNQSIHGFPIHLVEDGYAIHV